jgi:hypothetical protein
VSLCFSFFDPSAAMFRLHEPHRTRL